MELDMNMISVEDQIAAEEKNINLKSVQLEAFGMNVLSVKDQLAEVEKNTKMESPQKEAIKLDL